MEPAQLRNRVPVKQANSSVGRNTGGNQNRIKGHVIREAWPQIHHSVNGKMIVLKMILLSDMAIRRDFDAFSDGHIIITI
uniref:Uncharacterized protein n=1 Tax=Timema poppense TaxID=170557 RepID=A0A7R9D712_TIMPO|nr:unnamed protein product [Timema poppensis]